MIPENFPLAENIGPGHVPRHGSVTGTATERQQPLPCRLQAPAGNAAVFPGQAPRFGEPFFFCRIWGSASSGRPDSPWRELLGATPPGLPDASGERFLPCQEKYQPPCLPGRPGKGAFAGMPRTAAGPRPSGQTADRAYRRGTCRGGPLTRKAPRQGLDRERSKVPPPTGFARHGRRAGAGHPAASPARSLRPQPDGRDGRSGPARRERSASLPPGACHLRAFGLWKLVHRSTLRQRPGVPGNALRRIFRCLPVMGPGAAAGRVAGSGPVWKITTLLED